MVWFFIEVRDEKLYSILLFSIMEILEPKYSNNAVLTQ